MFFFKSRSRHPQRPAAIPAKRNTLHFDQLEDRCTPAVISGYVYQDANNDGVYQASETPIANSQIQLKNAQGVVVGTTTTDSTGKYSFAQDATIPTQTLTVTKTVTFNPKQLDFNSVASLPQFDPSLGTLVSVTIQHNASVTSNFQVENLNTSTSSTGTATVGGTMTFTAPGVNDALNMSANAGTFNLAAYDGTSDYSGPSGTSFGPRTATNSDSTTLTGSAVNAYIDATGNGTGTVQVSESSKGTSSINGASNLQILISSTGQASITVTYTYQPTNGLKPGNYTIVQTSNPPGYLPGLASINNVPIPGSNSSHIIPVTLSTTDLTNNNFAELLPSSITGHVFQDANNNGIFDAGETPIANDSVQLLNAQGVVVGTATTNALGVYQFSNLTPGQYAVQPTSPSGLQAGKINVGTLGGTAGAGQISGIAISNGGQGQNYDFGYIAPSTLSGTVYEDVDGNGAFGPGDNVIPGAAVTITGTQAGAGAFSKTVTTDANGGYSVANLLPGTYSVSVAPPAGYIAAKINPGTTGGVAGTNQLSNITVPFGGTSAQNNFGEVKPTSLSGYVYTDLNANGVKDAGDGAVSGVTVTATGTDNYGNTVSRTAVTDSTGFYQFTTLIPGTYTLTETQPAGYANASNNVGSLGGVLVGANAIGSIATASGQTGTNYNFGEKNPANADLSIVKTANVATATVGSTLYYTLTVTNNGPYAAANAKVADTLPSQATLVSATGAGWTISNQNGVVTATQASLPIGTSTIVIAITVPAVSNSITNTATVTSDTPDPNPLNNTSTITTPVTLPAAQQGQLATTAAPPQPGYIDYRYYAQYYNYQQYGNAPGGTSGASVSNQTFVDGLYQTLTGASPSAAVRQSQAAALDAGTLTRAALIQQVSSSTAAQTYSVTQTYQSVLGRAPSQGELNAGIQALALGQTAQNLAVQLVGTTEYSQKFASNQSLLAAGLYVNLLNILPSTAAQQASLQSMSNQTVQQVAQSVLASPDGLAAQINNAFQTILRRGATTQEIAQYLPQLQSNTLTIAQLDGTLLSSNEFYQLALSARKS